MVRSLWSAATGMNAQQTNVDTIANNLANVNSAGYKGQVAQFKSLLYQNLRSVTTTANGDPKPTTSQVGLGVRLSSINSIFTQGSLLDSQSDTAFAIEGDGFFAVRGDDGTTYYTRNGDFTWALGGNGGLLHYREILQASMGGYAHSLHLFLGEGEIYILMPNYPEAIGTVLVPVRAKAVPLPHKKLEQPCLGQRLRSANLL